MRPENSLCRQLPGAGGEVDTRTTAAARWISTAVRRRNRLRSRVERLRRVCSSTS
jgi:hypothetical protein